MEPEIIPPNEPLKSEEPTPRSRTGMIVGGALAVLILGAAGVAAATGGFGPGFGGHHMRGHFMEYGVERALDGIDATPAQTEKIWKIIDEARAELRPVARGFHDSRDEVMELLGAATIDRAAAEKLRAERIAAADQASRRMTDAILDVAEVLTPEQRAKLVEHVKEHRSHRRWR